MTTYEIKHDGSEDSDGGCIGDHFSEEGAHHRQKVDNTEERNRLDTREVIADD